MALSAPWKGQAIYYDLATNTRVAPKPAWSNLNPSAGFEPIAGAIAVMAAQVERCTVNGEQVVPQPGGFYGGGCSIQRMSHTGVGFPAIWFGPWVRVGRRLRRTQQRSADGSAWRVKRG